MDTIDYQSRQESDDGWETVVSRKTKKRLKAAETRNERKELQRERDLKYLQQHHGFQRCRLRAHAINEIVQSLHYVDPPIQGTWLVGSLKQCRGHVYGWNEESTICGECHESVTNSHCCCSSATKELLSKNFYLGFEGSIDDYLSLM